MTARLAGAVTVVGVALGVAAWAETVAWYRFEEGVGRESVSGIGSVEDSSGNRLDGTPASPEGATPSGPVAPFGEAGLSLNGEDNWVFVPDVAALQLTRGFTLEAYVRINRPQKRGACNFIVFRGDDRSGCDAYWLGLNPHTEEIVFGIEGPGRKPGDPPAILSTPFQAYDKPVHLAGVLSDRTGLMGLYVDGELRASMHTSTRSVALLDPLQRPGLGIGGFFAGPPGSFCVDGDIDEVRLSNVALRPGRFLSARAPEGP